MVEQVDLHSELMEELRSAPDRSLAIVGVAYIEDALQFALAQRLGVPAGSQKYTVLFADGGALGGARAKAEMAWALELFGDKTREDLRLISQIRNRFAHKLHERSIDEPVIAKLCDKIRDWTPVEAPDRRLRLLHAIVEIAVHIETDSIWGGRRSSQLD